MKPSLRKLLAKPSLFLSLGVKYGIIMACAPCFYSEPCNKMNS